MIELLNVDTSRLPKPKTVQLRTEDGGTVRVTLELGSIRSARAWGTALGIVLRDTDPECRYIMVRQEAGTRKCGPALVHLIGTESTPPAEQDERRAVQAASRIAREAVTA